MTLSLVEVKRAIVHVEVLSCRKLAVLLAKNQLVDFWATSWAKFYTSYTVTALGYCLRRHESANSPAGL